MSQLMEQAFWEAKRLPESDQEAIAAIIFQEIEAERRWEELFSRPESADLLSRMADEALAGIRAGRAKPLGSAIPPAGGAGPRPPAPPGARPRRR